MWLTIQFFKEITFSLEAKPSDTIKSIKDKIQMQTQRNFIHLRLYYQRLHLENNKTLKDYGITTDCILSGQVKDRRLHDVKSKELLNKSGYLCIQTEEVDQNKEIAHTQFKLFIRDNKDKDEKPQKLNGSQFKKILSIGEPIQPKLVREIFAELNLEENQPVEEQEFLTYYKNEVSKY